MLSSLFNTVAGKRVAVLGFAFKADTGDTRESPAIAVVRGLLEERAEVVVSDPKALENARLDLKDLADRVTFEPDPYKAVEGAQAVAVLTEWKLYKELDYARVLKAMKDPAFVFDGRNILDHKKLFDMGFNVIAIGKSPLRHF
jgi:UDPglucose 6-dehydrogenase